MRSSSFWFWIEVALACLSLLAFVATLVSPTWIEQLFGVDPDGGDGTLEQTIVLFLSAISTVVMAILAWRNSLKSERRSTTIRS